MNSKISQNEQMNLKRYMAYMRLNSVLRKYRPEEQLG